MGDRFLQCDMRKRNKVSVGDLVEVLSKEEILGTLDGQGQRDRLPFMPEMLQFCGQRFRVYKRAHKTCDTVNKTGGRRMGSAVHLEGARCDGAAHGGCQAGCLLFWKEVWLRRIDEAPQAGPVRLTDDWEGKSRKPHRSCTEGDLWRCARSQTQVCETDPTYVCQATELPEATTLLKWWDMRQYWEDYRSGNVSVATMLRGFAYMGYNRLVNAGLGLGPLLRWLYDKWQRLWGGPMYPRRNGTIPPGQKTPGGELGLQPGELVRVRRYEEILATLDQANKNRGMLFDAEMVPYCGGTFRVLRRVCRIVNEKTGKLQEMKNPCIILEGVWCQSRYSDCRLFCPRAIFSYWREIWLERVQTRKAGEETGIRAGQNPELNAYWQEKQS